MTRAKIFDASYAQYKIDLSQAQEKVTGAILKVADGRTHQDIRLLDHVDGCLKGDPKFLGGYQYLRSYDCARDKNWWKRQADFYLESLDNVKLQFGDVIKCHWADLEKKYNSPSMRFGEGTLLWIDYVAEATGDVTGLYTSPSVYQEWLLGYGQKWMPDVPLWCAQYPYSKWNDDLLAVPGDPVKWNPRLPAGFEAQGGEWIFWQYGIFTNSPLYGVTPQYSWQGKKLDLNISKGSEEWLLQRLGLIEVEQPEIPEDPEPADCSAVIAERMVEIDEFILDVLANVRKTASAMGEDTAALIEQDYEDLKTTLK